MWAVRLLYLGLGLFFLGWALLFMSDYPGDDDNLTEQIGLLMPHLGFLTLLLAGLCGLHAGVSWAARMAVTRARRRRLFP